MKQDGSGFMTHKEKEWVVKVQLLQLQGSDPEIDDYYYLVCVCVCVCVRERERERERERVCVCVCVCERERERERVCVCVCVNVCNFTLAELCQAKGHEREC